MGNKMLTKHHLGLMTTFLRTLRTQRRIIGEPLKKNESIVAPLNNELHESNVVPPLRKEVSESTILPLSEQELQELQSRDIQFKLPNLPFKPKVVQNDSTQKEKEQDSDHKTKEKKKIISNLKKFALKIPLAEAPTIENQHELVKEAVTPLCKIPYHKQLKLKQNHAEFILRELKKSLKEVEAPITKTRDRLACPLENIIPSPDILHYRNKDEFSVHIGVDGNPKTVGYYIGHPTDPNMRCIPPTNLVNIRESHKLVAKHFETFIRASPHEACLKFDQGGVWRNIIVRSNLKGELMAVVIVYSKDLHNNEKEKIKEDLKEYFFSGPGSECQLNSLFLQACPHARCSRELAPFELIDGAKYLEEECMGKVFRISPDTFFQINTKAAELLYHSIQKVSELSPMSTLLDICCGTGIISILMSEEARGAIGIDITSGAIADAKLNAHKNGIRNVQYICGPAEKVLPPVTKELEDSSDVVAIVNPARGGFHPSVIECIRQCSAIKKIIFVTCKPEGNAMRNMAMLGATVKPTWKTRHNTPGIPKKDDKKICDPFSLRYAIPVDLFPQTLHVEFVFLFERMYGYDSVEDDLII